MSEFAANQARENKGPMKIYTPPEIPDERSRPQARNEPVTHLAANRRKAAEQRRAAITLSNSSKKILQFLQDNTAATQKEMQFHLSLASGTTSRSTQELLKAGFAKKEGNADGIAKTYRITPAGEAAIRPAPKTEKHSSPSEAPVDVFDLIHRSTEIIKRASEQLREGQQTAPALPENHPDVVLAREILPLLSQQHQTAVQRVIRAATGAA